MSRSAKGILTPAEAKAAYAPLNAAHSSSPKSGAKTALFKLANRVARVLDDHAAGIKRTIHPLLFRQIVERGVFVRIVFWNVCLQVGRLDCFDGSGSKPRCPYHVGFRGRFLLA